MKNAMLKTGNIVHLLIPLALLLLCAMTYGQVLNHELMIDDFSFWDQGNKAAFFPHLIDFFVKTYDQHYAPFYNLMNVTLFRAFRDPHCLYLVNLGLFYSNCLLIFYFVYQISRNIVTAVLTSTFFCIHPMSGEVLQHLTLDNILLAASMMLLGLLNFHRYLTQKGGISSYLFSMLFLIIALLCQEISLLFIFYAASMAFILTQRSLKEVIQLCIPFIMIESLFFVLWIALASSRTFLSSNIQEFHLSFWGFCANYFHLNLWYIGNLFIPASIVFMHNAVPVKGHIGLWLLFFMLSCSGLTVLLLHFKRSIESFSLVLFFLGFLIVIPAFGARPYMGFIFEPNWLYFSSIGFYLFMVLMFQKIKDRVNRWLIVILLPMIFMYFFLQTQQLNIKNSTQFSYCENWLRKSPGNTIPANILALEYYIPGRVAPDLEFYGSMLSLVDLYLNYGHYETALQLISKLSPLDLSLDQRKSLLLRKARAFYQSSH